MAEMRASAIPNRVYHYRGARSTFGTGRIFRWLTQRDEKSHAEEGAIS